jgi:hypothetical protein
VTRDELISDLRERNEQARAEIERREREREENPAAALSHNMSMSESWAETIRSGSVQKSQPQGILHRDYDGGALAVSARGVRTVPIEAEPPDFDELVHGLDVFAETVTNKLLDLERENIELRAKLDAVLTLLGTGDARKKLWTP